MRVGVIGAGAVGGTIAALLYRGGHEVEITARGAHLAAVRERGIHLTGAWDDFEARTRANEVLTGSPELAILATKAQDAAAALRENARLLRGIPVVVVQNGLDGLRIARAAAPGSDILGGLAMFASSYLSPGEITVTNSGPIYLGGSGHDLNVPARYAAGLLGEVVPTRVIPNFTGAQWTKLVVNQVNALPAITGLSVQDVVSSGKLRRIMTASMRETVRIGLRNGVRFESLHGLGSRQLRLLAVLPLWAGQLVPLRMSAGMGRIPNPGSTLQSIRRRQPTEIDYLNGAVVRAAARVGAQAPVNASLVQLVHEVERTRKFIEPDEVARRVALS